jgi:hypothetical protein
MAIESLGGESLQERSTHVLPTDRLQRPSCVAEAIPSLTLRVGMARGLLNWASMIQNEGEEPTDFGSARSDTCGRDRD